jgi:hypothetical protein
MSGERRYEVGFALGNVLPVAVLSVGLFALPVRWWPADVVVGAAILAVLATSAFVMSRPAQSRPALRIGAQVLLGIGLLIVAAAVLSMAFLAGIHGDFGRGGVTLMILVAFLVLPYTIVYPAIQLLWLGPRPRKQKATAAPPSPEPDKVAADADKAPPARDEGDTSGAPA